MKVRGADGEAAAGHGHSQPVASGPWGAHREARAWALLSRFQRPGSLLGEPGICIMIGSSRLRPMHSRG